jgi:hypothetical protein
MESPSDQDPRAPRAQSLPTLGLAADKESGAGERDLGLWIAADGSWHYQGSPIRRIELVKLFASVLRREADGYWLVTPAERGRIGVEDAPFVAVELERREQGAGQCLRLRTNLDQWLTVGPQHPIALRRPAGVAEGSGPAPYVLVRDGLEARVTRSVYYELAELAEPGPHPGAGGIGVWSEGAFFTLQDSDR